MDQEASVRPRNRESFSVSLSMSAPVCKLVQRVICVSKTVASADLGGLAQLASRAVSAKRRRALPLFDMCYVTAHYS